MTIPKMMIHFDVSKWVVRSEFSTIQYGFLGFRYIDFKKRRNFMTAAQTWKAA
jgi:hypothetical protein